MGLVLPTIEAYQVQHLPIVKAYADKIGSHSPVLRGRPMSSRW